MTLQPQRINSATISGDHEYRLRVLERPRNPPWLYFTPVNPAVPQDDYIPGYSLYPPFASPWLNLGFDANNRAVPGTAFRIFEGKLQIRLFCTGGEDQAPSLIGTLPNGFWPPHLHPLDVVMGEDKLDRGTVEVRDNGEIWFLGFIFGSVT